MKANIDQVNEETYSNSYPLIKFQEDPFTDIV